MMRMYAKESKHPYTVTKWLNFGYINRRMKV